MLGSYGTGRLGWRAFGYRAFMPDREKERLDDLGREIDEARTQAQEHDTIPNPDHGERFYETDDERDGRDDDQTLTPPG